jgi:DMSO reductase family type II enzyme heme b subunit
MRRTRLWLFLFAVGMPTCVSPSGAGPQPSADRGEVLYARHCAACHGEDGSGETVAAGFLLPRPAPFRQGRFKLVSSTNGVPTEDDLVATLRRGMPGTTMMSWSWLPDADLHELAREVRWLAIRGLAASLLRTAAIAQRQLTPEQATAEAERAFEPGPAAAIGDGTTDDDPTHGRRVFLRYCAACHGEDARGLPVMQAWPATQEPWWSRDLTFGPLRGGGSARDLALRIGAGMPGANMPPTPLSAGDLTALVGYLQRLLPSADDARQLQVRRTLRVVRVDRLPADDGEQLPARVAPQRLPLAALRWRPGAADVVWVRAAHDGEDLLLRLEWADASRGDRVDLDRPIGDGAAVQFTREPDPPPFPMGTPSQPVNVWRWRSYGPKDTAGMADLLDRPRHVGLDAPSVDLRTQPRTESAEFHGIASAGRDGGLPIRVHTHWHEGRWSVTFRRSLRSRDGHEVDLVRPGLVLFALAIWDSRIDDHAGSKVITTWNVLEFDR